MDREFEYTDDSLGVSVATIVTYPKGTAGANCLCDAFIVRRVGNRLVMVLCDGCSWGERSRRAAQLASREFCDQLFVPEFQNKIKYTSFLYNHNDGILFKCHKKIIKGHENVWNAGSTTLCGGMLVKLQSISNEWAFLCSSIGDCKAFRYRPKLAGGPLLIDLTKGNRANTKDATDPGGRIGPYCGKKGTPDFRNKAFSFTPCQEGDLVFIISDGVYDNFDPEHLGTSPCNLMERYSKFFFWDGPPLDGYNDWSEVPPELVTKIKEDFILQKLERKLNKQEDITPNLLVKTLLIKALKVTRPSRLYMEMHPLSQEPVDYREFPGKMDHTTCICVRIQNLECPSSTENTTESDKSGESPMVPQNLSKPQEHKSIMGRYQKRRGSTQNSEPQEDQRKEFRKTASMPSGKDKDKDKGKAGKTHKDEKKSKLDPNVSTLITTAPVPLPPSLVEDQGKKKGMWNILGM
eukprot:TRINITY_DN9309_c0_g1_i3.p1 TRINITY_DN9309_c0_g1~~TRINITY_DN9309_c0_g1_i3.p1  ORF type:complete len:482 (-),score=114.32 TRINITY_DN9309_c0_g1_i3:232-1620(-)